jgi:hypothetical protein
MWEQMSGDTADMSWLATALTNGTVIMAADGSYNRNKSTLISGAGWIIRCLASGKSIQGSAYEKASCASSYRGEMLGLLALYATAGMAHVFINLHMLI